MKDGYCNLSGLENLAARLYNENNDKAKTSAFVLDFIANTLYEMAVFAREKHGELPIVFGGGVMSNMRMRKKLVSLRNTYFAEPALSTDNAVGIAMLTKRKFTR